MQLYYTAQEIKAALGYRDSTGFGPKNVEQRLGIKPTGKTQGGKVLFCQRHVRRALKQLAQQQRATKTSPLPTVDFAKRVAEKITPEQLAAALRQMREGGTGC